MPIHPTAIVDSAAEIDPSTEIGPFCVIQGPVKIGPDSAFLPHCFITGHTTIGSGNRIGPFVCIGTDAQSLSDYPDDTGVVIGDRNQIREFAQVHRSITAGHPTRLGNDNLIMTKGHVAHDCQIGNGCVLTNGAHIGGHAEIGDRVNLSSPSAVHQFVRVGRLALLATGAIVTRDVPPFMIATDLNTISSLNVIGLRRAGIGPETRAELKRLFTRMYRTGETITDVAASTDTVPVVSDEASELIAFCRAKSKRGIISRPRRASRNREDL